MSSEGILGCGWLSEMPSSSAYTSTHSMIFYLGRLPQHGLSTAAGTVNFRASVLNRLQGPEPTLKVE